MSRVLSAAVLSAAFSARFPSRGNVGSIEASGDKSGKLEQVDAMGVRGYAPAKLQWVKATAAFRASGERVVKGDFVQVLDNEAKSLIARELAEEASDEDVAKAQKAK